MTPSTSPLTTDLYELNMVQAYLDRGEDKEAVFEFFVRRLPARRGFLLAAGLADALDYLETLRFSAAEIDWLKSTGRFRDNLLDYLGRLPLHRRRACDPGRQRLLCQRAADAHHRAAAAGAAGRNAADQHSAFPDADRVEGRAHGAGGAGQDPGRFRPAHRARRRGRAVLRRARAISPALPAPPMCWPASATASRSSAPWRIPSCRCTTTRCTAFENFARARPEGVILLIDTYDTEAGARKVVELAPTPEGRRHRDPRRAHRQRRSHRDGAQGAAHSRRRRPDAMSSSW